MTNDDAAWIAQLKGLRWFHAVGRFQATATAFAVSSWEQAVLLCNATESDNARLQFANEMRLRLRAVSQDLLNTWNSVSGPLRSNFQSTLLGELRAWLKASQIPEDIVNTVRWDVMHAGIEWHFASHLPEDVRVFTRFLELYKAGHFPCGWQLPRGWVGGPPLPGR